MEDFNKDIYHSNPAFPASADKPRRRISGPKIVFVILIIIIIVEVIYAIRFLNNPFAATEPADPPLPPKIILNVQKTSPVQNETIPVAVILDTGEYIISGADLIVRFDPKILEASGGGIVRGNIFEEYPLLTVDSKEGTVSVSGVNSVKTGFKGIGQLATLNFKAKAKGNTYLIVEFVKDSTVDSNLIEADTSKDILQGVENAEFNIQ